MYKEAYKVACLGVTDGDWRALAMDAMEVQWLSRFHFSISICDFQFLTSLCFLPKGLNFDIAKKVRRCPVSKVT